MPFLASQAAVAANPSLAVALCRKPLPRHPSAALPAASVDAANPFLRLPGRHPLTLPCRPHPSRTAPLPPLTPPRSPTPSPLHASPTITHRPSRASPLSRPRLARHLPALREATAYRGGERRCERGRRGSRDRTCRISQRRRRWLHALRTTPPSLPQTTSPGKRTQRSTCAVSNRAARIPGRQTSLVAIRWRGNKVFCSNKFWDIEEEDKHVQELIMPFCYDLHHPLGKQRRRMKLIWHLELACSGNPPAATDYVQELYNFYRETQMLCEAFLKELRSGNHPRDHKVINIWLIMLTYADGGAVQKSGRENVEVQDVTRVYTRETLFD